MLKCANYFRRINQSYSNCRVSFAGLYNTEFLLNFTYLGTDPDTGLDPFIKKQKIKKNLDV